MNDNKADQRARTKAHRDVNTTLDLVTTTVTVPNDVHQHIMVIAEKARAKHFMYLAEHGSQEQVYALAAKRVMWTATSADVENAIAFAFSPSKARADFEGWLSEYEAAITKRRAMVKGTTIGKRLAADAMIVAISCMLVAVYREVTET